MHLDMNAVVSCIQFSNDSVDLVEASLDIKSNIFMEFLQVCLSVFVCNDIIMTNFDILKQAALMTATSHGRRGMIHTSRKQQPQRLTVTIDRSCTLRRRFCMYWFPCEVDVCEKCSYCVYRHSKCLWLNVVVLKPHYWR